MLSTAWALWEVAGKGWQPVWGIDLAARVGVIGALAAAATVIWQFGRVRAPSAWGGAG